jgi:GntR family transcriptional repressor for pyruvate dehydrogenase complex
MEPAGTAEKPRRAFEDIIGHIREAVVAGQLSIGDRLPHERELAERFEVSRQSVREALRMLEGFGVLTARRGVGPASGWIVAGGTAAGLTILLDLHTSLRRTSLWDILEIRESLEMLSIRSAAAQASAEEKAALVAAAHAMEAVHESGAFLRCDTEFHVSIARRSGNSLAPLFMEAIRDAMARVMLATSRELPDWDTERETLAREHLEIATLIAAGQGDAAAAVLSRHIRGFYGRWLADVPPIPTPDPGRAGHLVKGISGHHH